MNPALWVDVVLAVMLVGLAVAVLRARDLFVSIMLFVAWGLLLALAWARMAAPDVALAEAALGAGLTGALLLGAARALGGTSNKGDAP